MNEEGAFLRLSEVLCGKSELDGDLSRAYLARLKRQSDTASVGSLLDCFLEIERSGVDVITGVRDRIYGDKVLAGLAKTTLLLWYTGSLPPRAPAAKWEVESEEQYFGALVWGAIGAHAPAASTGFFGHWRYEPVRGGR